jgi:hypothetical protein
MELGGGENEMIRRRRYFLSFYLKPYAPLR